MSRPIVLITLSLMVGIATADVLFYERFQVPAWLDIAAWGFCFLVALVALCFWRRPARSGVQRWVFPSFIALFFATVGFMRYATYAAEVHEAWDKMERPPVNRGNPDEFDYVRWRWIQGVEDTTSWTSRLRHQALEWRAVLEDRLATTGMDEMTLAVVTATTLGDRSRIGNDTRDLYAAAGASHLLALSGLHLGVIVGWLLTWINGALILSRWRKVVAALALLFVWTYALVAGLPTSLLRASLMTSLFIIASLIQRHNASLQLLLLTVVAMLLWRPIFLFDVGAQLSCLAVAGILLFYTPMYVWIFDRWRFVVFRLERYHLMWLFTIVAVSLCAQLLTWPLVAYYFHRLPTYGVLLSVVLIPLTTALLYLSLLVLALSWLWPIAATWISGALSWIVGAQLWLMTQVTHWPGAVIHDFWSRKAEPQVVVYNNWRCPALHLIASPEQSWLLMPKPEAADSAMAYIAKSFWQRRLTKDPVVLEGMKVVAVKGFSAVMIDNGSGETAAGGTNGASVDVLWITKGFEGGRLGRLTQLYNPQLVVLDAGLAQWQRKALKEEATRVGWRVYDVAEEGALRLSLK